MSHYISVKDSDYDVLRNVVALLKKNKKLKILYNDSNKKFKKNF